MAEYVRDPTTGLITLWNGYNGTPERAQHRYRRDPATGLATSRELVPTPDFGEMYVTDANGLLTPVRNLYDPTALVFDFANGYYQDGAGHWSNDPSLIPGWTYSPRTGTEYASTSSGLLVPFASGVPAVTDLGLQVWEARTNLLLWSQAFATNWNNDTTTIVDNAATAPDGTTTAALLTATGGNLDVYKAVSGANGVSQSWFVRPGTATWAFLQTANSGNTGGRATFFNLATGAVGTVNTTAFGTPGALVHSGAAIQAIGGGWFRISVFANGDTTNNFAVGFSNADASRTITSGKTGYIWGAQLEQAAFAGPYCPTTSASATRGAASASVGGLSLPSAWTLYGEADFGTASVTGQERMIASWNDGSDTTNAIKLVQNSAGFVVAYAYVSGSPVATLIAVSQTLTGRQKLAMSYDGAVYRAAWNGTSYGPTTAAAPTGVNQITIGQNGTNGGKLDGIARRVIAYPTGMSASQLAALTQ